MLKKIDALKDGDYRFFEADEGHKLWKAKLVKSEARPALVNASVELATTEYAVTVTVSPVDDSGSALRNSGGLPIVIDSHTHVFHQPELESDEYKVKGPLPRIMKIIEERVAAGQAIIEGNQRLENVIDGWSK